jgi:FMN phosphatase YigB (HAD superfamily)
VKPRLLALDIGGVLVRDPIPVLFEAMAEHGPRNADEIAAHYRARHHDLWSGSLAEADFWATMIDHAQSGGTAGEWRDRLASWMEPLPALRRVCDWSKTATVYALSNHRAAWIEPVLDRAGVLDCFDALEISDRTGRVKPDSEDSTAGLEAWTAMLAAWGGDPARSLYVDDKPLNCRLAERTGMRGLVADPEGRWVDEVDRWLATD